ncbi:pentapeptide repeat-containing protein [Nocardia sp. NPDC058058]|uniref:pentapeptide repeat-containing protein n=1 Tax=Nocardia sp. NPDC058058 TaxID=3346317 RepID=UPI0036DD8F95
MLKFFVNRDKQFAERFSAAIDHLGSANPLLRSGSIRELDRIMHASPRDQNRVLQTYADFLRYRTREGVGPDSAGRMPCDVAAVLNALRGRRRLRYFREEPLDLTGIRLARADLREIRLPDVCLAGADLIDTDLSGADLRGANLVGANLSYTNLCDANLTGADLTGADLCNADLTGAQLTDAVLHGAELRGTHLREVTGLAELVLD